MIHSERRRVCGNEHDAQNGPSAFAASARVRAGRIRGAAARCSTVSVGPKCWRRQCEDCRGRWRGLPQWWELPSQCASPAKSRLIDRGVNPRPPAVVASAASRGLGITGLAEVRFHDSVRSPHSYLGVYRGHI